MEGHPPLSRMVLYTYRAQRKTRRSILLVGTFPARWRHRYRTVSRRVAKWSPPPDNIRSTSFFQGKLSSPQPAIACIVHLLSDSNHQQAFGHSRSLYLTSIVLAGSHVAGSVDLYRQNELPWRLWAEKGCNRSIYHDNLFKRKHLYTSKLEPSI